MTGLGTVFLTVPPMTWLIGLGIGEEPRITTFHIALQVLPGSRQQLQTPRAALTGELQGWGRKG